MWWSLISCEKILQCVMALSSTQNQYWWVLACILLHLFCKKVVSVHPYWKRSHTQPEHFHNRLEGETPRHRSHFLLLLKPTFCSAGAGLFQYSNKGRALRGQRGCSLSWLSRQVGWRSEGREVGCVQPTSQKRLRPALIDTTSSLKRVDVINSNIIRRWHRTVEASGSQKSRRFTK